MRIRPAGWVLIALLLAGAGWYGARRAGLLDAGVLEKLKSYLPSMPVGGGGSAGPLRVSDFPQATLLPRQPPAAPAASSPMRLGIAANAVGAPEPAEGGGPAPHPHGAMGDAAVKAGWETVDYASEAAALAALAADRGSADAVDAAEVSLPAFASAFPQLRKVRARAFLLAGWGRGRDALVGGTELQRTAGLKGKRLAAVRGSGSHYLALFAFARTGLQPGDVQWEAADNYAAAVEAFRAGKADAYAAREPLRGALFPVLERGPERLVPDVLVARGDALDGRRAELLALAWHWSDLAADLALPGAAAFAANRHFFGLLDEGADDFVPSFTAAVQVWKKAGVLDAAAEVRAAEAIDAGIVASLGGDGEGGWSGAAGAR